MEKGAFRRIAAPFIRDTARRATLPRPCETMRPSIYRMKTRAGGETWTEMRVALQRATRPTVSETEGGGCASVEPLTGRGLLKRSYVVNLDVIFDRRVSLACFRYIDRSLETLTTLPAIAERRKLDTFSQGINTRGYITLEIPAAKLVILERQRGIIWFVAEGSNVSQV